MEQIVIKHPDGSTTLLNSGSRISGITKAEQSVGLLAEDTVTITVKSATPLEFVLGDTIEVYGKTYTINQLPTVKKAGTRKFEYTLTFEGVQYELIDAQFLLPDNTIGDSFTGNLLDFLQIVIVNVLRVFPNKWVLGEYPQETEFKTLTFSGRNCLDVLQDLCKEYSQEFEITQNNGIRTLNIRKAGVAFPYTFRYGKTGGLYELTRQNINSKNVVTRLYVYGGSNNLGNTYRHSKLCIPGSIGKNDSYIENTAAIAAFGLKENTKVFDNIFPNRYGEVTGLGSKYYAFIDNTMNFDLNEKESDGTTTKWLINGVTAKVKMTSGNLAGYEFELHKYDKSSKEIQVVPFTDENGMKFPSETSAAFQFDVGDKYIYTDINLPDAYKTEAEAKLQEEGENYYLQNCQPQVQYGLNIDQNFIKQFAGQLTVVNLFAVGDYIPVKDEDLGVDKSIRITEFKRDLLQPYKYSLTLGDNVTKTTITRVISELRDIDKIIRINNLANPSKARRSWRASQEVLAMVFDPEGDYYSNKIKPLSIETSMLQVGAKSMQFVLRNVVFEPNYQGNPNYMRVTGGHLIHSTIEDAIRTWEIAQAYYSNLESNTAYYIYGRCSKTTGAGSIVLDTTQRKVDDEAAYYNFMIGVLNSVETDSDGKNPARFVSLTYGSSTINGRFIKTGRINSTDGNNYLDLDNNLFRVGDSSSSIAWNENNDGKLRLKGTLVQSESGEEQPLGCFRGAYNADYTYYKGDQVTYNGSTFRYTCNTPSKIPPTNATAWMIVASKGENGEVGPSIVFVGEFTIPNTNTYYGNSQRVDVIRYNNYYYVTRVDAGTFAGSDYYPTDTSKWNFLGSQFESVATKLLLAENANIAGWIFRNNQLEAQNGSAYLNGINGSAQFANGNFKVKEDGGISVKGSIVQQSILYTLTSYWHNISPQSLNIRFIRALGTESVNIRLSLSFLGAATEVETGSELTLLINNYRTKNNPANSITGTLTILSETQLVYPKTDGGVIGNIVVPARSFAIIKGTFNEDVYEEGIGLGQNTRAFFVSSLIITTP